MVYLNVVSHLSDALLLSYTQATCVYSKLYGVPQCGLSFVCCSFILQKQHVSIMLVNTWPMVWLIILMLLFYTFAHKPHVLVRYACEYMAYGVPQWGLTNASC